MLLAVAIGAASLDPNWGINPSFHRATRFVKAPKRKPGPNPRVTGSGVNPGFEGPVGLFGASGPSEIQGVGW